MKAELIAALDAMDINVKTSFVDLKKSMEEAGWRFEHTYYVHASSLYEKVWEHPVVTNYNDGLSPIEIYKSLFFTLYELPAEHQDLNLPPLYMSRGRIGNTTDYLIHPPVAATT